MRGLAEGFRSRPQFPPALPAAAFGGSTVTAARMVAPAYVMPVGSGLTIPRLVGVPFEQQLWDGEQSAARISSTFLQADIACAEDWSVASHNPFHFMKKALDRWLAKHHAKEIRDQFHLDVTLSTTLDQYGGREHHAATKASQLFLTVEPDSAGYTVLGPTLRLLEAAHPRLPVTFAHHFLGALNRWIRVYDHRDAQDRVDTLREWYESDPEGEEVELPDVERCIPDCMKRRPRTEKGLAQIFPVVKGFATQLIRLAVELDRVSRQAHRPVIDEEMSETLMDSGTPLPSLLAVFERHDAIEGCFDEDAQGMLELTPEPNLIIPLNGEDERSVRGAFGVLAVFCETLACASRLMKIMPGNERLD
jgi:hypothetical protein